MSDSLDTTFGAEWSRLEAAIKHKLRILAERLSVHPSRVALSAACPLLLSQFCGPLRTYAGQTG